MCLKCLHIKNTCMKLHHSDEHMYILEFHRSKTGVKPGCMCQYRQVWIKNTELVPSKQVKGVDSIQHNSHFCKTSLLLHSSGVRWWENPFLEGWACWLSLDHYKHLIEKGSYGWLLFPPLKQATRPVLAKTHQSPWFESTAQRQLYFSIPNLWMVLQILVFFYNTKNCNQGKECYNEIVL